MRLSLGYGLCAFALAALVTACGGSASQSARVEQPAAARVEQSPDQPVPAPAPAPAALAPEPPITITVVGTNDVHGRIEQLPLLGGYVANLRALRAREGGAVLLIDAGDIFQGTLPSNMTEGAAMVRGYNALAYTAAAVGNHEFDFGPVGPHTTPLAPDEDPLGALRQRAAEASFPLLCANVSTTDGGAFPIERVHPSVLLDVQGVAVGVVGGVTEEALALTQAPNVKHLTARSLPEAIAREASALRARGAVLVIATVHAGGECNAVDDPDDLSSCVPDAEAFQLARALPAGAVDLIVAGHTHQGVAQRVNGIPIIEAYANLRAFGRVDFRIDRRAARVLGHEVHPPHALCTDTLAQAPCTHETYAGAPVARDANVSAAIAADVANAAQARAQLVGVTLEQDIKRAGNHESPLGNLVADLMREEFPDADAVINNGGSVRTSLAKGPLTYGQLFEMFPFDNTFATLRIEARLLAAIIAKSLQSERSFLALSGLRASARCEGATLAVTLQRRDGKRLAPDTLLRVVTSDFLAVGGDDLLTGLGVPQAAIEIHRDRPLRDALVRRLGAVPGGRLDGRSRTLFDPARPRVRYAGTRPLRCPSAAPAPP